MQLSSYLNDGVEFIASPEWLAEGVCHGFFGRSLYFDEPNSSALRWLSKHFGAATLLKVRQIHGAGVQVVDEEMVTAIGSTRSAELGIWPRECEVVTVGAADGILVRHPERWRGQGIALGIVTADCVPLLLRAPQGIAVVHAGWRGLAAGVIERTVELLAPSALEVVVGPCAGSALYEVESEVIAALGERAKFSPQPTLSENGTLPHEPSALIPLGLRPLPFDQCSMTTTKEKFLLDLRATARRILLSQVGDCTIADTSICTIADSRFHSFRRDKSGCGKNLSLVLAG